MSRPGSKALSRDWLNKHGWPVVLNAEQYGGGRFHDLFGALDLVCARHDPKTGSWEIQGVQACWRGELEAHMAKIHGNEVLKAKWLDLGLPVILHLWPDLSDWEDGDREVQVVNVTPKR